MSDFKQWTTIGSNNYFPAGDVVTQLPPGYYDVNQDMRGLYFKKRNMKTETPS
jgi:hypothetical protein